MRRYPVSRSRSPITGSGRLTSVLVKHTTQITSLYWPGLRDGSQFTVPRRAVLQPLVRPGLLVVLDELPQHVLQMQLPEDPSRWSTASRLEHGGESWQAGL